MAALVVVIAAAATVTIVVLRDDHSEDHETTAEPQRALHDSFGALRLPAPTGVAITPVGGGRSLLFGDQTPQDAWSTIKAPLGLAAERMHGMSRTEAHAVIDSDNRSARILTRSFGGPDEATKALENVLREGGDMVTEPARRHGRDFPMLGETRWALADSAGWTANLPCLTGSEHMLELMRGVSRVQDWGVRRIGGRSTAVKGGWGEAPDGGYVVRQIGLVTLPNGSQAAVSASVHKAGMTFETGTAALDQVAHWLKANLTRIPGGECPAPAAG